ncbi:MAG: hypothetical protein AAB651_00285 [Patescibacteria group bacterium]
MREIKRIKKEKKAEKVISEGEIKISKFSGIAWQAPEYEYRRKDVSWYWLSLIAAIILFALAIWQRNFLFAVFVVLAWIIVIKLADRFPSIWEFKLDEKGISIGLPKGETIRNKFYPYSDIDYFDILSAGEDNKELVLKFKSRLSPFLKINIHSADEEKIKAFLLKFLKQKTIEPSLLDSVSRLIRF